MCVHGDCDDDDDDCNGVGAVNDYNARFVGQ